MGCAGSKVEKNQPALGFANRTTKTIYPKASYVLKTQRVVSGDKFFINVCTATEMWPFPAVLVSSLREDVDKKGNHCQCVDAVIHPEVLLGSNTSPQMVNIVIIRKVASELKAFNIAENKSALSFPEEENLSEDYKLPNVQDNYKGGKIGPLEMGLQNLAKSSYKTLEKTADTFILLGKFKGMRTAFDKMDAGADRRILYQHAAKLIQTAWRHHKKHIITVMKKEAEMRQAATALQSVVRAKNARKSVKEMRLNLSNNGGFPPVKTGWIVKRGHVFRTWRKRYFVLEKGVVTYYADEKMKNQKGQVVIKGYNVGGHSKLHSEELYLSAGESGGTDLLLSFEDKTEKEEWRDAFEAHIQGFLKRTSGALKRFSDMM